MKCKLTHSLAAKTAAIVLFLAFATAALASGVVASFFAGDGVYEGRTTDYLHTSYCYYLANEYGEDAYAAYIYGDQLDAMGYDAAAIARRLDPRYTNFRYAVTDQSGALLSGTLGSETVTERVTTVEIGLRDGSSVTLSGYLTTALSADDPFSRYKTVFDNLYPLRSAMIVIFFVMLLIDVLLFIFLMCASGRHADSVAPRAGLIDRIPYDIYFCIAAFVIVCLAAGAYTMAEEWTTFSAAVIVLCFIVSGLFMVSLCMTTAARIKLHTFWRNMLITWILRKLLAFFRWIGRGLSTYWANKKLLTRVLLVVIALCILVPTLTVSSEHSGLSALLLILLSGFAIVYSARTAMRLEKLYDAGARLAAGDYSEQVDTKKLRGYLKQHGENLNSIQLGVSRAVDARMKSERMKTDLITNVSHDLKTPLTSIVNYVDLLKKEDLGNETAKGYIEVLDRQAERLKKLTVDLVEASKASSGTINAVLAPTSVAEAVNQSVAEYLERLEKADLTPVVTLPEEGLSVIADGRLLWRVLDNLLSNVTKYSQPGTRVYIDAVRTGNTGVLTVKNVSREQLNIAPEELMERFVRGDESRATEGSGLGLSIAKSLTELMHGALTLTISGDLFTATLTLPIALAA